MSNNLISLKTNPREYKIWGNMKQRCFNPKNNRYKDYGYRGITVCDRWANSFVCFYNDMGDVPKNKSLDRINVDGIYEPSNCRWATRSEQSRNRRDTVVSMEIKSVLESNELNDGTYKVRLSRGWSHDKAILGKTNIVYKNNVSKVKGVYFIKSRNRWRLSLTENGKYKCFGYFSSLEAATDASNYECKRILNDKQKSNR
jgi:hypothetical protein